MSIDDSSRIPLIAPLINLFKDRNEECEELRNYFVQSTNNESYCRTQAQDGFEQAEKTEELMGRTRGEQEETLLEEEQKSSN